MLRQSLLLLAALACACDLAAAANCTGTAGFRITFSNRMTPMRFGDTIPSTGLFLSPPAGVSHSNRQSFLTVRGFASQGVSDIAKIGNSEVFLNSARRLRRRGEGVIAVASGDGPINPGEAASIRLRVNCTGSFVTVVSMIAPSPDWIVQINNMNLFNMETGRFEKFLSGDLIAYDAGVDSGFGFTDPSDPSVDEPTIPPLNIAPLVEDETDVFNGRVVGQYSIVRVD